MERRRASAVRRRRGVLRLHVAAARRRAGAEHRVFAGHRRDDHLSRRSPASHLARQRVRCAARRRGLDILQRIQKMAGLDVMVSDADYPEQREVDLKLIELARELQGKIVTNDFNLNKVAQLRGVDVLNINELANSLKPVVLPGETMKVFILKEGKEYNQGVAYLDDGTMVVVDNARSMIGKTIDVVVTSVLQTTAGKMIFGRSIDANAGAQTQPTPIDREGSGRRL